MIKVGMQYMKALKFFFRSRLSSTRSKFEVLDLRGFNYIPRYFQQAIHNTEKCYLILDNTVLPDYAMLELSTYLRTLQKGYVCVVTNNLSQNTSLISIFANENIVIHPELKYNLPDPFLLRYMSNKFGQIHVGFDNSKILDAENSRLITEIEKETFGLPLLKLRRKRRVKQRDFRQLFDKMQECLGDYEETDAVIVESRFGTNTDTNTGVETDTDVEDSESFCVVESEKTRSMKKCEEEKDDESSFVITDYSSTTH
jgi:hypothetical protein